MNTKNEILMVFFAGILLLCMGCSHRIQKIILKPGEDVTIHTPMIDYEVHVEDNTGAIIEDMIYDNATIEATGEFVIAKSGEPEASIWWDPTEGQMKFKGNTDEAFEGFFAQFKEYVDDYIKENTKPFKIIDKNTYMVILERPEQKVIIRTPNGNESAVGYIEYYKIAAPSIMEIDELDELSAAIGIKNSILLSVVISAAAYSLITKNYTPVKIISGLTAGYYGLKYIKTSMIAPPSIKEIFSWDKVEYPIWDLTVFEVIGNVEILFENDKPAFYHLYLQDYHFMQFKFDKQKLMYRNIERSL